MYSAGMYWPEDHTRQRLDVRAARRIVGKALLEVRGNSSNFRLRRPDRRARREPADHQQGMSGARQLGRAQACSGNQTSTCARSPRSANARPYAADVRTCRMPKSASGGITPTTVQGVSSSRSVRPIAADRA